MPIAFRATGIAREIEGQDPRSNWFSFQRALGDEGSLAAIDVIARNAGVWFEKEETDMKTFVVAAALLVAAGSAQAQWVEIPDAPEALPLTAQATFGMGPLTTIMGGGTPGAVDFCDAYCIRITDPMAFSATTVGGAGFDTQLFLFTPAGMGVTFNDDSASTVQSTITGAFVTSPGVYILAISRYDYDPGNAGGEIWSDTPFGVERAPDGPGAGGPVAGWAGSTAGSLGAYTITLTGAAFCDVPAPGAITLLGLSGIVAVRRRRA